MLGVVVVAILSPVVEPIELSPRPQKAAVLAKRRRRRSSTGQHDKAYKATLVVNQS
jgi:hypothetical protein